MTSTGVLCIIILAALVVFMDIYSRRRRTFSKESGDESVTAETEEAGSACCGKHKVCEKQRIADAMAKRANYFEDEDLDRFEGRDSDSYEDAEVEEFRYVMYTMQQDEVLEWLESLKVRSIELPDQLKDEACMMIEQ